MAKKDSWDHFFDDDDEGDSSEDRWLNPWIPLDVFFQNECTWREVCCVDLISLEKLHLSRIVRVEKGYLTSKQKHYYRCVELSDEMSSLIEGALHDHQPVFCRLRVDANPDDTGNIRLEMGLKIEEIYRVSAEGREDAEVHELRWMITGFFERTHCDESEEDE